MFRKRNARRQQDIEHRIMALDAYMDDRRQRLLNDLNAGIISSDTFLRQSLDLITEIGNAKIAVRRRRLFPFF